MSCSHRRHQCALRVSPKGIIYHDTATVIPLHTYGLQAKIVGIRDRPVATKSLSPSHVVSDVLTRKTPSTKATFVGVMCVRTTIPSASRAFSRVVPTSVSSRDKRLVRAKSVTREPRRKKACASSSATTDAPITMRWATGSRVVRVSVEVQYGVALNPGIEGTSGRAPVAIKNRSATSACDLFALMTRTVWASSNWARP